MRRRGGGRAEQEEPLPSSLAQLAAILVDGRGAMYPDSLVDHVPSQARSGAPRFPKKRGPISTARQLDLGTMGPSYPRPIRFPSLIGMRNPSIMGEI